MLSEFAQLRIRERELRAVADEDFARRWQNGGTTAYNASESSRLVMPSFIRDILRCAEMKSIPADDSVCATALLSLTRFR